jgi:hypothetical protein
MFVAPQRSARFEPDTMTKPSVPPNAPAALPPLMAAYVEATNSFDLERLMATFAEDALVNDQLRDHWGKIQRTRLWTLLLFSLPGSDRHRRTTGAL